MWQFIQNPGLQTPFLTETVTFLQLCIVPSILALIITLPLGILIAQRPLAAFLLTNFSGLMRAVPTIVFLFIALPYLGTGFRPSVVALTALGIPPILLNTIASYRSIDPAVTDAARGMGMTSFQLLWRIQIPLMLPVVAAGVRTATIQIVATAPIAALIGGGGYGDYILYGISLIDIPILLVGALPVALLALLFEVILASAQRLLTPAGLRVAANSSDVEPAITTVSKSQSLAA